MKSIIDYLEGWAGTQPQKPLFGFINLYGYETDRYTYSSFHEKTRNLADHLSRQEGLKAGDKVLLAFQPGLDIVVAFFACARLGVIPVPVVPPSQMGFEASMERLTLIVNDCHAVGALTNSGTLEYIRKLASGTRGLSLLNWILTDGVIAEASRGFRNRPNPVLFLQYTSGSTGDPRGVMVSHDNVIHNARSIHNARNYLPIGVLVAAAIPRHGSDWILPVSRDCGWHQLRIFVVRLPEAACVVAADHQPCSGDRCILAQLRIRILFATWEDHI